MMRRIFDLAAPFKGRFALATFFALSLAIVSPLRPWLIQMAVDDHILLYDGAGLQQIIIYLLLVLIGESAFRYFFIYCSNWLGQSVTQRLRTRVFDHIMNLKLKYFDRTPIGASTTRTINDVEAVNDIFSQGIITIIADTMTILTVMIFMFLIDWKLTLVSLSTFPLFVYCTYVFKERIRRAFAKVREQVSRINSFLQEHIQGMRIIQIFTAEEQEMEKFRELNREHRAAHIRTVWYFSIFFPIVEIILASAIGLMVWYGANSVLSGVTTLGVLMSFILYINMLFRPLRMLADKFNTLQLGLVAAERVFLILDRDDTITNQGKQRAEGISGEVEFRNVWFAYDDEEFVLKDVSFKVKAGETLAIVGHTGSGKTSIINTLNRNYELNKGSILVDGVDTREYELSSLREQISNVMQDVFLFSGSVLANITMRNKSIRFDEVVEAAKQVGAHEFISKLPGGYDYDVMERGSTLSMGQRQLISFIRALAFDPRILILDEATSSIDTETELIIQHAIEKLISDRTSIIIAHRLSTIRHADKILVLDKGEIIESGTHDELLQNNGHYRSLYEMQFKNPAAASI